MPNLAKTIGFWRVMFWTEEPGERLRGFLLKNLVKDWEEVKTAVVWHWRSAQWSTERGKEENRESGGGGEGFALRVVTWQSLSSVFIGVIFWWAITGQETSSSACWTCSNSKCCLYVYYAAGNNHGKIRNKLIFGLWKNTRQTNIWILDISWENTRASKICWCQGYTDWAW